MTYQYKREPLSIEEADRLLNAATTFAILLSPQQFLEELQRKW